MKSFELMTTGTFCSQTIPRMSANAPGRGADQELDSVEAWFREQSSYVDRLRKCVRQAIDEVIDTPRTGRFKVEQLNPQEKSYIGTKVETVIRAEFDLPYAGKGHKDYLIAGHEVDCKWSGDWGGWEIPTEQYGHLCLLIHARDSKNEIAVGLIRTLEDYINPGRNKDSKSNIRAADRDAQTRWLIPRAKILPVNFLLHLPEEDREAILTQKSGVKRAYELYSRCEGMIVSRHLMESVGRQKDDSRRFRGGRGGVRKFLAEGGYEVLNGTWVPHRLRAAELGGPVPPRYDSVCLHTDGKSAERANARFGTLQALQLEAEAFVQTASGFGPGQKRLQSAPEMPADLRSPDVEYESGEASPDWDTAA